MNIATVKEPTIGKDQHIRTYKRCTTAETVITRQIYHMVKQRHTDRRDAHTYTTEQCKNNLVISGLPPKEAAV